MQYDPFKKQENQSKIIKHFLSVISKVSENHLKIGAGITFEEIEYNRDIKMERKNILLEMPYISNIEPIKTYKSIC